MYTALKNYSGNIPTILIIFGATGDLMRKKLIPALFSLHKKEKLPPSFKIVGFSRRDLDTAGFKKFVADTLKDQYGISHAESKSFLGLLQFEQGNFDSQEHYKSLNEALKKIDRSWGVCTNKLFYLSVAPGTYKTIFHHLSSSSLTESCSPEEGWTRVIVEKPFGENAETAHSLDTLLGKLFKEVQIYRIDHYLAKEMLQNILAFRFSNNLFEKNWSNETIERIEIKLWEKIGVELRGAFYDGIGALRDVGQNHLLQMLALVTMDLPKDFSADAVRQVRAEILKTLKVPASADVKNTIRGQYKGYRSIAGVNPASNTETYFKINAELLSPRWREVPITIESGKRMGSARKEITVFFKHPAPCLCLPGEHHRNKVVFVLEPEERITIHFWSKKPGLDNEMEERTFEFLLRGKEKKGQYVEEYEKLLLDCVLGDQTRFISTDEVNAMWKFVDPIVRAWQKDAVPLKIYDPDTGIVAGKESLAEKKPLKREIGLVGLGKMGMGMAERLVSFGWGVAAFDLDPEQRKQAAAIGVLPVSTLKGLSDALRGPKLLWLMVPAGKPVDDVLFGKGGFATFLKAGDVIIDGGNSFFKNSTRRAKKLERQGIYFLDVGVSGGPEGARLGSSLMIGGNKKTFEKYEHLFNDLAVSQGYGYVGPSGAGHFVKMVHNGIEYGMMQAIAEGFALMQKSPFSFQLEKIAEIYNHGSVIESRLMSWLKNGFAQYGENLREISGTVGYTGEGEWTVKTAKKLKIPVPIIEGAFQFRVRSKKNPSFTGKVLSALRNQFGGHSINPSQKGKEK